MTLIAWPLLLQRNATQFQRLLGFCYACLPILSVTLYVAITSEVTELGYVTSTAGILYYITILFMQMVGSIGYLLMVKERDELRLYQLASTDHLTGILNRKAFYDYADVHFQQAISNHQTISFAIIDIDHFKQVNDTYGHQIGDEVLKRVSFALMAAIRKNDVLARFGGEEFVLCFPEVTDHDTVQILERLQNSSHTDLTHTDPPLPPCTLSIGLATGKPQLGDSIEQVWP